MRPLIEPSPTSVFTGMMRRSSSSRSQKPGCLVGYAAKRAFARAFGHRDRVLKDRAVQEVVRIGQEVLVPKGEKSRSGRPATGEDSKKDKEKGVGPKRPKTDSPKGGPRKEKVSMKEDTMAEGISLAEQGSIAKEFLEGLLASMNIKAEVSVKELDSETVELAVNADPPH